MTEQELIQLLESILCLGSESEVIEFKRASNGYDTQKLGAYFSALSNEANLKRKECGWLIFGVNDSDHQVVGTNYKPTAKSLMNIKREIAEGVNEGLTFNEIHEIKYSGKRVLMFQILPAPQGIPISYNGHYYGRDGESLVALNISEIESIRSQAKQKDWSAEILNEATVDDLDPDAICFARTLYTSKHKEKEDEIRSWSDVAFLNKAKITIKGRITNTAILLLGKDESEYMLSPAISKIRWILKDSQGVERDYLIKGCPLVLSIEEIYRKIRNLKYRYINPEFRTLFPEEIDTYEPYIIREALNNAIAHQDYSIGGQINVVEYDDKLVFTNRGSFIPKSIQHVLVNDAPEEVYRNPFLVQAMVNLKMVDTIGSGIRKMFSFQRQRLFPLPDYNLEDNKVQVTIIGKILNFEYASILSKNTSLTLSEIELLNRIQLGRPISGLELDYLRKKKLVEGRKPNIYLAKAVAQKIDQKIEYSNNKGFDDCYYCDLIIKALSEHKVLTKKDISGLLLKKLPDILTAKQKYAKIQNLLTKLRKQNKIDNESKGIYSYWRLK